MIERQRHGRRRREMMSERDRYTGEVGEKYQMMVEKGEGGMVGGIMVGLRLF